MKNKDKIAKTLRSQLLDKILEIGEFKSIIFGPDYIGLMDGASRLRVCSSHVESSNRIIYREVEEKYTKLVKFVRRHLAEIYFIYENYKG